MAVTLGQDLQPELSPIRAFVGESVPRPRRCPEWVDSAKPTDLEIGCGVGLHPIRYARAHPERRLIAIEHTKTRFLKFERRLAHHTDVDNIIAVHANAIGYITHIVPCLLYTSDAADE